MCQFGIVVGGMVYKLMTLKSELLEVEILYDLEDIATFMVL